MSATLMTNRNGDGREFVANEDSLDRTIRTGFSQSLAGKCVWKTDFLGTDWRMGVRSVRTDVSDSLFTVGQAKLEQSDVSENVKRERGLECDATGAPL